MINVMNRTEERFIKIKDLVKGYISKGYNGEEGVWCYDGKLIVRPSYQRELVYKELQQKEIIHTILEECGISDMYWVEKADGTYEVLDGQQRIMSICNFYNGQYFVNLEGNKNPLYFNNLINKKEVDIFLNHKIRVYIGNWCIARKKRMYRRLNIQGEVLTKQELRNSDYDGDFIYKSKKYFTRQANLSTTDRRRRSYMKGSANKQEHLETVIKWICDKKETIEGYMARKQYTENTDELINYFKDVFDWVEYLYDKKPVYKDEMKGLDWGFMYNKYSSNYIDKEAHNRRIIELMKDDEVKKKSGIFEYILGGERDKKLLNLKVFDISIKKKFYYKQDKRCANKECLEGDRQFELSEMEADHIIPWSEGGKTEEDNCQVLCRHCNRVKSSRY